MLRRVQSNAPTTPKLLTYLKALVAAGCAIAIGTFIVLAIIRLGYPYELEWLESEMLEHVRRLHDGLPLYTSPTVELTQLPYAPLSFGVGALLSELFGVHFWVLRAVSIVATLATLAMLMLIVHRESGNRFAALVAAGIYAATYRYSGTFFDVGKADALFILLSVSAIYFARGIDRSRNAAIAGLIMALAILTKQTALFFFVPLAIYLVATKWRFGTIFSLTTAAVAGVTTLILHAVSNGWYTFFVWELLFQHDVAQSSRIDFFTHDLVKFIPVVLLVALAAKHWTQRDAWWVTGFYAFATAGLIAGAWTGRLHTGGYSNVLMPAAIAMALLGGLALAQILRQPTRIAYLAVALAGLQLALFHYNPGNQLPTAADKRAGDQLIATLRSIDGDVWLTRHPAYASMANKSTFAGQGGIEDVLRAKHDGETQRLLRDDIATEIHNQRFAAIIFDDTGDTRGFPADWQNYYERSDLAIVPDDGSFTPVASRTGAPRLVWVRKQL